MVPKGVELPVGDPRKYKDRVVVQGNSIVDQDWTAAVFQDFGSSLASMGAAELTDSIPASVPTICNKPTPHRRTCRRRFRDMKHGST